MTSDISDETRWEALTQRDQAVDGTFVYGVVTTGIYCRPTCSSKRPKRENVLFFKTSQDAESAGFRPCKRCHPDTPDRHRIHRAMIIAACQRIADSEDLPSLKDLADTAGYSPTYFHRLFKNIVGVTPKQYAAEIRAKRVRTNLQSESNVIDAIYAAGFNSNSRFYDTTSHILGMHPSTYRQGGAGAKIRYAISPCYLGWVLIAATEKGLCAVEFGDNAQILEGHLRTKFSQAEFVDSDVLFTTWVNQVLTYLDAPRDNLNLPLDIRGTVFQQQVWQALRQIPPGSPASYSQIAERINQPKAARAVARACAANPIAVAIPCHRVIRQNGSLGGYRWGIERKRQLLEKEAQENDKTA
jgi:AraC family transcriptional regulator of adaptative response/methylated-DNA-[protein]-cysteine methyltransferase